MLANRVDLHDDRRMERRSCGAGHHPRNGSAWLASTLVVSTLTVGTTESAQPAEPPPPPPSTAQPPPPPAEEENVDLTGGDPMAPPGQPPGAAPPPYPYPYGQPQPYPPVLPPEAADEEEEEEYDEEDGEPHGGTQRNFGFGPRIGGLWAFGAGARAGHRYFGVDFSGGWQPLVPTITPAGSDEGEMELYHSWQLSLLGYVAFNPDSTFVAGATTGYCYNSVIGRGFVLAFEGIVNFSNHLGLHFHVGGGYFPDGEDRMRAKKNIPDGSEFGSTPDFQSVLGLGLIIYP